MKQDKRKKEKGKKTEFMTDRAFTSFSILSFVNTILYSILVYLLRFMYNFMLDRYTDSQDHHDRNRKKEEDDDENRGSKKVDFFSFDRCTHNGNEKGLAE